MTRTLEIILILFFSALCFFLGVKYSASVKERAGWIFESSGDEVELPDLSDTQNPEMDIQVDENGKAIEQATPPAEDQNIVPSIDDQGEAANQSASEEPKSETAATSTDKAPATQPEKPTKSRKSNSQKK